MPFNSDESSYASREKVFFFFGPSIWHALSMCLAACFVVAFFMATVQEPELHVEGLSECKERHIERLKNRTD